MTKPTKTLEEMAAEAAGCADWTCPRCGCKDWRVHDTADISGGKRRVRICRHCGVLGPRLYTMETPERIETPRNASAILKFA